MTDFGGDRLYGLTHQGNGRAEIGLDPLPEQDVQQGPPLRVLLVKSDRDTAAKLMNFLQDHAIAVELKPTWRSSADREGLRYYDLILLDSQLADRSGFEICAEMRRNGLTCPILMLSVRNSAGDQVQAFDAGADDFLAEHFEPEELLARVRGLLLRRPVPRDSSLHAADLTLDVRTRRATRGRAEVKLTQRECLLLEYLLRNAGRVLDRSEIAEHVWDETYDPFSNLIEVYVHRLRRKLDQESTVKLIHTKRGKGYFLEAEAHDISGLSSAMEGGDLRSKTTAYPKAARHGGAF
jgi:two-component system copper resistance phosphate regulon response regulator CusR